MKNLMKLNQSEIKKMLDVPYVDVIEIRLKRQKNYVKVIYLDGIRLNKDDVPEGMYLYQTRHSDTDISKPVTIKPVGETVIVNFCGTIISSVDLNVKEETKIMDVNYI